MVKVNMKKKKKKKKKEKKNNPEQNKTEHTLEDCAAQLLFCRIISVSCYKFVFLCFTL